MTIHELPGDRIARFRAGDRDVFAEILKLCYNRVYFIAFTFAKEEKEAEDITLTTFFKLWERRDQFGTPEHIDAFLLTTCRNAGVDCQRAIQRRKKVHRAVLYLSRETEPSREQQIIRQEWLREMISFLDVLSPKRKEVIRLLYLDGMKVREVAAHLGISPITVQGHKASALKKLRVAFSKKDIR
jgi:RNA polymerase sigma-70 factor (ECF subfamily)